VEVTTVKLRKSTKSELDKLMQDRQSYDDVIRMLVSKIRDSKLERQLIQGYSSLGKDELQILKEWDYASSET